MGLGLGCRGFDRGSAVLNGVQAFGLGVKALEKLFRQGLGHPVDQALSQLGDFAADLGGHAVTQLTPLVVGGQGDFGRAFAKSGDPALPFKVQGVAARGLDVREHDLATEFGRHGADLECRAHAELMLTTGFNAVTAGDADLQHLGVIERVPRLLLLDFELAIALHFHDDIPCCF